MRSASFPRGGGTGTAAFRSHSLNSPATPTAEDQDQEDPLQRGELMTKLRAASDDDPILWTTPWRLVKNARISQTADKWPPGLFAFFEQVLRDHSIIEINGAHSFLDVLFEHRDRLDNAQKDRLRDALNTRFWISSPLLFQSLYRMKEYLANSPAEVIKLFQDASDLAIHGKPSQMDWALGLFKSFELVGRANIVGSECSASTELHEGLSFSVSLPQDSLRRLLAQTRRPAIRPDLYTARLSRETTSSLVLERLDETLRLLDAYGDKRRLETLTTLPAALAITQAQRSPWSSRVFDALFDNVSLAMEAHGLDPQVRFLSIFNVLKNIRKVTPEQKTQALTWIRQNIGCCIDEVTQRDVAKFVVSRYGEDAANALIKTLMDVYPGVDRGSQDEAGLLDSFHRNHLQCASGVASALAVCIKERADERASLQSRPQPQAARPPGRLRRAGEALAQAASSASDFAALEAARLAVSISPSSLRRSGSGTPSWSSSRQGSVSPGDSVSPAATVSPRPPRLARSASAAQEELTVRVQSTDRKED